MGRSIRDFEHNGKLWEIIKKTHRTNVYEQVENLKWHPTTEPPVEGQMIIVCRKGWNVEVGHFVDRMFFHEGWDWADEFAEFDGWMPMPLPMPFPMNWKEEK